MNTIETNLCDVYVRSVIKAMMPIVSGIMEKREAAIVEGKDRWPKWCYAPLQMVTDEIVQHEQSKSAREQMTKAVQLLAALSYLHIKSFKPSSLSTTHQIQGDRNTSTWQSLIRLNLPVLHEYLCEVESLNKHEKRAEFSFLSLVSEKPYFNVIELHVPHLISGRNEISIIPVFRSIPIGELTYRHALAVFMQELNANDVMFSTNKEIETANAHLSNIVSLVELIQKPTSTHISSNNSNAARPDSILSPQFRRVNLTALGPTALSDSDRKFFLDYYRMQNHDKSHSHAA